MKADTGTEVKLY